MVTLAVLNKLVYRIGNIWYTQPVEVNSKKVRVKMEPQLGEFKSFRR